MQYKELNNDETASNENSLALREILERLLQNWYWFVLGFVIAWAGAYIYLRYTENLYRAEAKVLLKEDLSTSSSELSALVGKGMGRGDTKPNISDQIEIMRSRRLIGKVVDNLQLNIRYFSDGRVKQQELLDEASPVKVKVLTKEPSFVNFEVLVKSESDIEIIYNEKALKSTFGKPIKLGKVEFIVLPRNVSPGRSVQVTILPLESGISMYRGRLSIAPINEGSVVSVSMVDNLSGRAKRVIDELISQYNEDALYDKQLIGEKTTRFIEERLAKVSEDLRSKDRDVEGFKKDNQVI